MGGTGKETLNQISLTNLEYEATHPGAGRQHEEDVGEEHEVTFTLLLTNRKRFKTERQMQREGESEFKEMVSCNSVYIPQFYHGIM